MHAQEDAPELQMPLAHVSPVVQRLPSSHGPVLGVHWQPELGSHDSVVQGLPSSQMAWAPSAWPTHAPSVQVSLAVHGFLSLHGRDVGV